MKKLLHTIEHFLGIYRWHPKIALRYLPIVEEINRQTMVKTVLEVGSGPLGIAPYLGKPVTGLDIDFSGPQFSLLERKKGSILKLPFFANSFDCVICVDVLEHLPKKDRPRAVAELIRVARYECIIAVPCGVEAAAQDREIDAYYEHNFGKKFDFCTEHNLYGLPENSDIEAFIKRGARRHKRQYVVSTHGNINLKLRMFLMKGWATKNIFVDFFFRKILLLVIPFMRKINDEPTYRKMFFVRFTI